MATDSQQRAQLVSNRLRVLHIVLSVGETNATYNEHCLPMAGERQITLCTYFKLAIRPPRSITIFAGDGSLSGFIRALRAALEASGYDAIHAHSPHVALLFLIASALDRRRLSRRAIVTVHDSYPDFKLRNRALLLPVFAGFGRIVCCSRSSFASLPALYRWLAGRRLDVVQNGADIARLDRIAAAYRGHREDGQFNIVAVSRLVKVKNVFTVLRAFRTAMTPTCRLTYIGDGPLRAELMAACNAAAFNQQVSIPGLLPRDRVLERLLAADLFISASRGEGLPVAVLEAMAAGCPVLLSDIPPHREIVGDSGFIPLVAPDDSGGFAREIRRFREMSPAGRTAVGRQCRMLVEQRFGLEAMHRGYEAIYRRLTNGVYSVAHDR